jgi:hypothetical protein
MGILAHELRIGNKVILHRLDDFSGAEYHTIDATDIAVSVDEPKRFSPIPLTPEILEKCGFVKDGFGCYVKQIPNNLQKTEGYFVFSGDYLYLRHYNDGNRANDSIVTLWNKDVMKEFHLHKLQNIFFDHANTELPITL